MGRRAVGRHRRPSFQWLPFRWLPFRWLSFRWLSFRRLSFRRQAPSRRRPAGLGLLAGMTVASLTGLASVTLAAAPASAAGAACTGTIAGVSVSGGSAQTAKVGEGFANALQAEVVDTGGCPVSGVDVEFVAPTSGPSATFPGAATNATVETSSAGVASAPTLTANQVSGSYTVIAEVANTGIEADFNLTNTTAGAASGVKATLGQRPVGQGGGPVRPAPERPGRRRLRRPRRRMRRSTTPSSPPAGPAPASLVGAPAPPPRPASPAWLPARPWWPAPPSARTR